MPIETLLNNSSADKAGKYKERELQIFNPSWSESNLGWMWEKKFYHQGSEMLPSNKSEVAVKKAQTRTSHIMECEGKADFKEYKR